jgi:phosphohistidine phosphatase
MPRELLIMRHAKSSWDDPDLADIARPLTGRGKRDAEAMGRLLVARGLAPDLVLVSPAKRARSTLKRLVRAGGLDIEARVTEELYGGSVDGLLRVLAGLPGGVSRVLLIGHNPTQQELAQLLAAESVTLPTGAIAYIMLPVEDWCEIRVQTRGTLRQLLTPESAGGEGP